MKKVLAALLATLSSWTAYALPVGNPAEASLFLNGVLWDASSNCNPCDPCFSWYSAWNVRIGFYGDYVFDRKLKALFDDDAISEDRTSEGRHLQRSRLMTNAAYFAFNLCNRVDLFATVGASHLHLRTNESVFQMVGPGPVDLGVGESELEFRERFSWSVGARATLWECHCFALGVEGQYFNAHPELDYFLHYATGTKTYFDGVHSCYQEWQASVGVSYRIATSCPNVAFVPYGAAKWSGARFVVNRTLINPEAPFGVEDRFFVLHKFRSSLRWAGVLGLTFILYDSAGVTVEGRWGDEVALYVNGQLRF